MPDHFMDRLVLACFCRYTVPSTKLLLKRCANGAPRSGRLLETGAYATRVELSGHFDRRFASILLCGSCSLRPFPVSFPVPWSTAKLGRDVYGMKIVASRCAALGIIGGEQVRAPLRSPLPLGRKYDWLQKSPDVFGVHNIRLRVPNLLGEA